MSERTFRVWRGDAEGGEFKEYKVRVDEGMVVLDLIHRIQAEQANDLAVRWNCKAGKCGSCSVEINGKPKLACMTRMNIYGPDEVITVQPVRTFPIMKDLVCDVSWNYEQNKRIDMQRAAEDVPAGDPRLQQGDTVYLTVIDKDRNCCSFIQSNYFGFGSKVTPADVGFAMQNRGALFALDDEHLNRLEPGKRPFHTIIPAMVTHDGNPFFCFGVMGGDMQPQGHVQVLVNLIDFEMNVQAAGDAARVRHVGSATPTGLEASGVGVVNVESGIREAVIEELISRGHQVQRSEGGFGGYQGILIDPVNGVLHGGTESRKDGAAVGY